MPEGRSFRKQENTRPTPSYRLSQRHLHYFLRPMMYKDSPYAAASHFTQKQLYSSGQLGDFCVHFQKYKYSMHKLEEQDDCKCNSLKTERAGKYFSGGLHSCQ